jgi:hypothetical protein
MRVLNNFAYASGYSQFQEDLLFVEGVYAIVYYSIGKNIYTIKSAKNKITLTSDCLDKPYSFFVDEEERETNTQKLKEIEEHLFYTQVSNYSLYAYNTNDFQPESTWLNGIFHKNDGYQTPIVLNPMRTEGNIDVNKENSLAKDRLISLFVFDSKSEKSFRYINDKQFALNLAYYASAKSKFKEVTISGYFERYISINKLQAITDGIKREINVDCISVDYIQSYHLNVIENLGRFSEEDEEDFDFAVKVLEELNYRKSKDMDFKKKQFF